SLLCCWTAVRSLVLTVSLLDALPISGSQTEYFSLCGNDTVLVFLALAAEQSLRRSGYDTYFYAILAEKFCTCFQSGNRCRTSPRSEEHTSELQSRFDLVCRLLLDKKK